MSFRAGTGEKLCRYITEMHLCGTRYGEMIKTGYQTGGRRSFGSGPSGRYENKDISFHARNYESRDTPFHAGNYESRNASFHAGNYENRNTSFHVRNKEKGGDYQNPEEDKLLEELSAYDREGCSLFLNGRRASPARVASACFRENCSYMRDFIPDRDERIQEIHFIRLRM